MPKRLDLTRLYELRVQHNLRLADFWERFGVGGGVGIHYESANPRYWCRLPWPVALLLWFRHTRKVTDEDLFAAAQGQGNDGLPPLCELRGVSRLSQQKFWPLFGVTQNSGSYYESGTNRVPKPVVLLLRLWLAGKLTVEDLAGAGQEVRRSLAGNTGPDRRSDGIPRIRVVRTPVPKLNAARRTLVLLRDLCESYGLSQREFLRLFGPSPGGTARLELKRTGARAVRMLLYLRQMGKVSDAELIKARMASKVSVSTTSKPERRAEVPSQSRTEPRPQPQPSKA